MQTIRRSPVAEAKDLHMEPTFSSYVVIWPTVFKMGPFRKGFTTKPGTAAAGFPIVMGDMASGDYITRTSNWVGLVFYNWIQPLELPAAAIVSC
jgi:hypothetical protein